MQNRDILSVMAPMMDEETLFTLYLDKSLRASLRVILSSNTYWHARSEYLAGQQLVYRPLADWKLVYYTVEDHEAEQVSDRFYSSLIDNLHSLLAFFDRIGELLEDPDTLELCLCETSNLEVFDYMLARLPDAELYHILATQLASNSNSEQVVNRILELLPVNMNLEHVDMQELLEGAICARRRDIYDKFEKYIDANVDIDQLFRTAIVTDNLEMYKYIQLAYGVEPDDLIEIIIEFDAINILKSYFTIYELTEYELEQLLYRAMDSASMNVLKYLAAMVEPNWYWTILKYVHKCQTYYSEPNKLCLEYSVQQMEAESLHSLIIEASCPKKLFKMILDDVRYDPNQHLDELAARVDVESKFARVLASHPRVRTELLSSVAVEMIFDGLSRRADLGDLEVSASDIAGNDTYSVILRQIVFKTPRPVELLDWMISLHNNDIAIAAVLDKSIGYSKTIAPIRALLLSLLYPKMTRGVAIEALIDEGYWKRGTLDKSILLLSTWYRLVNSH